MYPTFQKESVGFEIPICVGLRNLTLKPRQYICTYIYIFIGLCRVILGYRYRVL